MAGLGLCASPVASVQNFIQSGCSGPSRAGGIARIFAIPARNNVPRNQTHDVLQNSRTSDQQFQAGQFRASCRAPQSTCRRDSLPLRRLESTTMPDSDRLRLSAQIVDPEQWCILG
jgi:hypothetical protein